MYRILLIVSLLPILGAMLLSWWFGTRVLWAHGKRQCRCDLGKWYPDPDDNQEVHRSDGSSRDFGRQLRRKAMAHWQDNSPKLAKAREGNRSFAMAVPPLIALVAVFAVIAGRIPPFAAIAIFIAGTALSTVIAMLSLPSELTAIRRYIASKAFKGSFPNSYDEQSVIDCALAHAWDSSLPPILKWLRPGSK